MTRRSDGGETATSSGDGCSHSSENALGTFGAVPIVFQAACRLLRGVRDSCKFQTIDFLAIAEGD
jgi:hypothetical protein